MIRKLAASIRNILSWIEWKRMASISIEMYRRAKTKEDSDAIAEWSNNAVNDVACMMEHDLPILTRRFIDKNYDILMDIRRTRLLNELYWRG
jgi:hypothetical protein